MVLPYATVASKTRVIAMNWYQLLRWVRNGKNTMEERAIMIQLNCTLHDGLETSTGSGLEISTVRVEFAILEVIFLWYQRVVMVMLVLSVEKLIFFKEYFYMSFVFSCGIGIFFVHILEFTNTVSSNGWITRTLN